MERCRGGGGEGVVAKVEVAGDQVLSGVPSREIRRLDSSLVWQEQPPLLPQVLCPSKGPPLVRPPVTPKRAHSSSAL